MAAEPDHLLKRLAVQLVEEARRNGPITLSVDEAIQLSDVFDAMADYSPIASTNRARVFAIQYLGESSEDGRVPAEAGGDSSV